MFGIANIVGPILGGVLTQHLSWRWCTHNVYGLLSKIIANSQQGFWINLPCGAVTLGLLFIFFHPKVRPATQMPLLEKFKHLDLPGLALFAPAVIMLLLALQWGGEKYAWRSATIIGLFCGFAGLVPIFCLWQKHQQDEASIPPSIFMQRTVFSSAVLGWFAFGGLQLVTYYLPLWFQVILGASPTRSGVYYLPSVLGDIVASVLGGVLGKKLSGPPLSVTKLTI